MGLERAERLAEEYGMIPPHSAVLCAVSGGADSMCLLHWLTRQREARQVRVYAAHFNHRLRGEESDRDEAFVRAWCQRWEVPVYVGSGDVAGEAGRLGLGVEETARLLRYEFLRKTAQAVGADAIATAHNADDNAETVLMNLIRGTGLHGLGGIRPRRGELIRPLLTTSRAEIEAYLRERQIPHMEDSTNTDEAYTRNRLRRQVMPLLRELNPRAVEHINAAAGRVAQVSGDIEGEAAARLADALVEGDRVSIPLAAFQAAPEQVRPAMLLCLLDKLGVGRKDLGAAHLRRLQLLCGQRSTGRVRQLSLPHGVTARLLRDRLVLELRAQTLPAVELVHGVPLRWGEYTVTLRDHRVGSDGLALRRPEGDDLPALLVGPVCPAGRLDLPGSNGPRTVKRLCLDRGIPLGERDGLPALYVGGRQVAVWRLGVDRAFLPAGDSCRYIQIKQEKEGN